jgi:type 1 fimbria pilin
MRHALAASALAAAAAAAAAFAFPAGAAPRQARCVVTSSGEVYRGPCRFAAERGGSFSISPVGRRFIVGEISDVSVAIVRTGVAEVRGLTADGINSRWGEARRSARDRACWVGSDFSVCAY